MCCKGMLRCDTFESQHALSFMRSACMCSAVLPDVTHGASPLPRLHDPTNDSCISLIKGPQLKQHADYAGGAKRPGEFEG